jgi:hypothetical protein
MVEGNRFAVEGGFISADTDPARFARSTYQLTAAVGQHSMPLSRAGAVGARGGR